MKLVLTIGLALHLLCSIAFAEAGGIPYHVDSPISTKPSPPLREFSPKTNRYARRIVTEKFTLVNSLKNVDPEVRKVFHSKVKASEISDRSGPFNPTDIGDGRPTLRFVLAGNAPAIWFILFEVGGIGYHHHLMVFTGEKNHCRLVASVSGFLNGNTFGSLVRAIDAGKFFDQPGYPEF